jgi:hypothetical protein
MSVFRHIPEVSPAVSDGRADVAQDWRFGLLEIGPLICRTAVNRYLKLIRSVRLSVEVLGFKGSFVAFALF